MASDSLAAFECVQGWGREAKNEKRRGGQGGGRRAAESCPHGVEGREPHRIDVEWHLCVPSAEGIDATPRRAARIASRPPPRAQRLGPRAPPRRCDARRGDRRACGCRCARSVACIVVLVGNCDRTRRRSSSSRLGLRRLRREEGCADEGVRGRERSGSSPEDCVWRVWVRSRGSHCGLQTRGEFVRRRKRPRNVFLRRGGSAVEKSWRGREWKEKAKRGEGRERGGGKSPIATVRASFVARVSSVASFSTGAASLAFPFYLQVACVSPPHPLFFFVTSRDLLFASVSPTLSSSNSSSFRSPPPCTLAFVFVFPDAFSPFAISVIVV